MARHCPCGTPITGRICPGCGQDLTHFHPGPATRRPLPPGAYDISQGPQARRQAEIEQAEHQKALQELMARDLGHCFSHSTVKLYMGQMLSDVCVICHKGRWEFPTLNRVRDSAERSRTRCASPHYSPHTGQAGRESRREGLQNMLRYKNFRGSGVVAEWSNAAVLKTAKGASPS
jgi:hypothetical protein